MLSSLSGRAKARFGAGRFLAVEDTAAVFALPNDHYLGRCEEVRPEVEAALAAHLGTPVPLRLVVERPDGGPGQGAVPGDDRSGPLDDAEGLEEYGEMDRSQDSLPAVASPEERLKQAFPGAEEVST